MKEKMPLVTSDDYGKDEASAQALLSRHNRLEGEIKTFGSEIKRLDELSQLMTKAASEHNVSSNGWLCQKKYSYVIAVSNEVGRLIDLSRLSLS